MFLYKKTPNIVAGGSIDTHLLVEKVGYYPF